MTDHWAGDRLGRRQDAEFLYNFLIGEVAKRADQGRVASYVLNVDADWGGGKSFFLDGLAQDLEINGHLVARVNAWRDDHAQDPYVAIMAAIDKVYEPYIKKPGKIAKAWKAAKTSGGAIALNVGGALAKGLAKKYLGVSTDALGDMIANASESTDVAEIVSDGIDEAGEQLEKLFDASLEAMISGFKQTDAAMSNFRDKLENAIAVISGERRPPLFILIDELDRCRPTYAVQLLERVKHLFDVPGVVFVFATNSSQLQHSIAGAYGSNFDGFRYLKRFFDRTYVFAEPDTDEMVSEMAAGLQGGKFTAPESDFELLLKQGFKVAQLDLRARLSVMEMIDATASAWPHKHPISLVLLFPLCVHFYKTGQAEWPNSQEFNDWNFPRTSVDNWERRLVDTTIHFGEAYRLAVNSFRKMSDMRGLNSVIGQSIAAHHAYEIFEKEWNGVRIHENQPSVQTQLLGIVANAGRMVNASSSEAP